MAQACPFNVQFVIWAPRSDSSIIPEVQRQTDINTETETGGKRPEARGKRQDTGDRRQEIRDRR